MFLDYLFVFFWQFWALLFGVFKGFFVVSCLLGCLVANLSFVDVSGESRFA